MFAQEICPVRILDNSTDYVQLDDGASVLQASNSNHFISARLFGMYLCGGQHSKQIHTGNWSGHFGIIPDLEWLPYHEMDSFQSDI